MLLLALFVACVIAALLAGYVAGRTPGAVVADRRIENDRVTAERLRGYVATLHGAEMERLQENHKAEMQRLQNALTTGLTERAPARKLDAAPDAELQILRNVSNAAIKRGAEAILQQAREAGVSITQQDAEEQARMMLAESEMFA